MANRLFIDEIVSVGAVTEGDNPDAEITFWKKRFRKNPIKKRQFGSEERERLAARGAAMPDGSFPIVTVADLRNAIQAFGRAKNKPATKRHIIKRARALGVTDMLPESWQMTKQIVTVSGKESRQTVTKKGDRMAEFDFDGFTDEQRQAVEKAFEELEETISNLEQPEEQEETPVEKASPEVQELIAKQAAELEAARAEIAKERQIRRDSEFLAKAAELKSVLGEDPAEWGPVLDEINDKAPEAYSKLTERLTAVKAQLETGALFKEIGRAGDGETDKVAALTKAKMELNPDLTVEQARALVWKEHPDLVEEARSR